MSFKVLEGVNNKNGISLINQIITLILEDEKDISKLAKVVDIENDKHYFDIFKIFLSRINTNNYPISSYTPKRLLIALNSFKKNQSKKELFKELLARFYYDICIEGQKVSLDYPPLIHIELSSRCNYKCVFCYQTDSVFLILNLLMGLWI